MHSLTKLVNFSYDEAKLIKRQFGEFFRFVVSGFPDLQPQPITSVELTLINGSMARICRKLDPDIATIEV